MKIFLVQAQSVGSNDGSSIIGCFATRASARKAVKSHVKEQGIKGTYGDGGLMFTDHADSYDIWTSEIEVQP